MKRFVNVFLAIAVLFSLISDELYAQHLKLESDKVTKANYDAAMNFTQPKLREMLYDLTVEPHWIGESDRFWYSFKTSEGTKFQLVDPANKSKTELFSSVELASALNALFRKPFNHLDLELDNVEVLRNGAEVTFEVEGWKVRFNKGTSVAVKVDSLVDEVSKSRWASFSPDSLTIIFARDHNLYMMNANDPDSVETQLTTDGERYFSYAADDEAEGNGKRVRAGANWFPDSKKFWLNRSDNRKVGDYWLVDSLNEPRPKLQTFRYVLPGEEDIPQYSLHIFDRESGKAVTPELAKWKDQQIGGGFTSGGGIYMGKSSKALYFLRLPRGWDKIDVCKVDTETGAVTVLFSDNSEPYFNVMYAHFSVLNDGKEFIWWSERDGWGHYYRYDSNGNLLNKITSGMFTARGVAKVDTVNSALYYVSSSGSNENSPYDAYLYRVNFDGTGQTKVTSEVANHETDISESGRYFVDSYSRPDLVPQMVVRDSRGNKVMDLETADISALEAAGWQMPEPFKIKSADGVTDLYGVMYKPFNLDSTKKYPIVTYVYPGPQTEAIQTNFSPVSHINTGLAQANFIVVTFGNRGGGMERSKWYHDYGYANLRDYGLEDKKVGIENLAKKYSFIDVERVGIYGASGGGFMSSAAILTYPDFFDACVSWAGNHDNNIYNRVWSEMHHGVWEKTDEEGNTYFESKVPTNMELAKNLKGHLLLMHGLRDDNVAPSNTYRLAQALIKEGKHFDMMLLPDEQHRLSIAKYQPYLLEIIWNYFGQHLLGDPRDRVEAYSKFKN